jgi:hypothetical protein
MNFQIKNFPFHEHLDPKFVPCLQNDIGNTLDLMLAHLTTTRLAYTLY